jgi:hypothetical protein
MAFSHGTMGDAMIPGQLWLANDVFITGCKPRVTGLAFPTIVAPLFPRVFQPMQAIILTALCSSSRQTAGSISPRSDVHHEFRGRTVSGGMMTVPPRRYQRNVAVRGGSRGSSNKNVVTEA